MVNLVVFPFRAFLSLFRCLGDALVEWWALTIATWRLLHYEPGTGILLEDWLSELDGQAETFRKGDVVTFWDELQGVVEDVLIDDGALRYDVRVYPPQGRKYLRPHEVDHLVSRREQS